MQVNLEQEKSSKMAKMAKKWLYKALDAVVPTIVILFIGLYTYAFAYRVVWKRVPGKGTQITLLTIYGVLLGGVIYEWILLHLHGPGVITTQYIKSSDDDPFLCDPQGYALWCSDCQHVKPNRAHHSSKLDRCVPVMDHYCIWIGAVIGQGNRKFFLMFSMLISISFTYVLVVLLIFQHRPYPDTMPLTIVLYILTGLLMMFAHMVTFQHIKLLMLNQTTLNSLRFRKNDVYLNFPCDDRTRRVVNITQKGLRLSDLFSHGAWNNCALVMGPVWSWLLPIRPEIFEPLVNEDLVEKFQKESEEDLKKKQDGEAHPLQEESSGAEAASLQGQKLA